MYRLFTAHGLLLGGAFGAAILGIILFRKIASRLQIVAQPNERSLHTVPVPQGGGIVVAIVFLVGLVILHLTGRLPVRWFLSLFVGGAVIVGIGFFDDVRPLSARLRMLVHILLAVWSIACLKSTPAIDFGFAVLDPGLLGYLIAGLAVVWMINFFNFMDGIDGMASSGVVFFSVVSVGILQTVTGGEVHELSAPIALLGIACLGFLCFNWPPARIFLGDAGSAFFGYVFAVFTMLTVSTDSMTLWTWVIIFGYYIGDTTTTLLLRVFTVKKWYGVHRSHAYQNLARVWGNHRRMTLLVAGVNVMWLLPMAVAATHYPGYGLLLALAALTPIVLFTLKYGPLWDR